MTTKTKARRARSSSAERARARGGELVRASVVARELGLSVYTIRRWLESGTMRGICIRRRWYTWRRVLDAARIAATAAA